MKVEREFKRSDAPRSGQTLAEVWCYGPTYIADCPPREPLDPSSEHYLFVHRYRLHRTRKGELRVLWLRDVENYQDEAAMLAAIEERRLRELPSDQPDSDWYPPEVARPNHDAIAALASRPEETQ